MQPCGRNDSANWQEEADRIFLACQLMNGAFQQLISPAEPAAPDAAEAGVRLYLAHLACFVPERGTRGRD